jgi:hypothetical protein
VLRADRYVKALRSGLPTLSEWRATVGARGPVRRQHGSTHRPRSDPRDGQRRARAFPRLMPNPAIAPVGEGVARYAGVSGQVNS